MVKAAVLAGNRGGLNGRNKQVDVDGEYGLPLSHPAVIAPLSVIAVITLIVSGCIVRKFCCCKKNREQNKNNKKEEDVEKLQLGRNSRRSRSNRSHSESNNSQGYENGKRGRTSSSSMSQKSAKQNHQHGTQSLHHNSSNASNLKVEVKRQLSTTSSGRSTKSTETETTPISSINDATTGSSASPLSSSLLNYRSSSAKRHSNNTLGEAEKISSPKNKELINNTHVEHIYESIDEEYKNVDQKKMEKNTNTTSTSNKNETVLDIELCSKLTEFPRFPGD